MTIWKYSLSHYDEIILMPKGSVILCVQTQRDQPYLWVCVNPKLELEGRHILTFGTGHPNVEGNYIGTYQIENGQLVFHVFEAPR